MEEVRKICAPILEPLRIPDWAIDAELTPELLTRLASPEATEQEQEVGT
jgi:hypothetical protein